VKEREGDIVSELITAERLI